MNEEIRSMLARWHYWRSGYTDARPMARAHMPLPAGDFDDDDTDEAIELALMQTLEHEIARLPRLQQLALAHVGRYEYLGVEVVRVNALPANPIEREKLAQTGINTLRRRLIALELL